MTRRRLICATSFAALIGGMVWFALPPALTPQERLLVGRWEIGNDDWEQKALWEFRSDRSLVETSATRTGEPEVRTLRWSAADGRLVIDYESNALLRQFRPLCRWLGVRVNPVDPGIALKENGPNRYRMIMNSNNLRISMIRVPAE